VAAGRTEIICVNDTARPTRTAERLATMMAARATCVNFDAASSGHRPAVRIVSRRRARSHRGDLDAPQKRCRPLPV